MSSQNDSPRIHVVVLAAGKGTRMESDLAKVLHEAAGRPLVSWVLDAASVLDAATTTVVVGHQADAVERVLPDHVETVLQVPQNGTGHAARLAIEAIAPEPTDVVVVLPGDMPLISSATLEAMTGAYDEAAVGVVVSVMADDPHGYGRIVRDEDGNVVGIVEELDADAEQRAIKEVNTSVYSFSAEHLVAALADVGSENAQGEQYLTDVVGWLTGRDMPVRAVRATAAEGMGVNTVAQLEAVSTLLEARDSASSTDGSSSLR